MWTLRDENPLIASAEETETLSRKGKQFKWCHLVMSNPRGSLLTKPNLIALEAITFEHFLHEERPDFAYSATIFTGAGDGDDDIAAVAMNKSKRLVLGFRVFQLELKLDTTRLMGVNVFGFRQLGLTVKQLKILSIRLFAEFSFIYLRVYIFIIFHECVDLWKTPAMCAWATSDMRLWSEILPFKDKSLS